MTEYYDEFGYLVTGEYTPMTPLVAPEPQIPELALCDFTRFAPMKAPHQLDAANAPAHANLASLHRDVLASIEFAFAFLDSDERCIGCDYEGICADPRAHAGNVQHLMQAVVQLLNAHDAVCELRVARRGTTVYLMKAR